MELVVKVTYIHILHQCLLYENNEHCQLHCEDSQTGSALLQCIVVGQEVSRLSPAQTSFQSRLMSCNQAYYKQHWPRSHQSHFDRQFPSFRLLHSRPRLVLLATLSYPSLSCHWQGGWLLKRINQIYIKLDNLVQKIFINLMHFFVLNSLPGQGSTLHCSTLVGCPGHNPPFASTTSFDLLRVLVPLPQSLEHSANSDCSHSPHWQWIAEVWEEN